MKFVPDLPQPATLPEAAAEVKALAGAGRAKPVQARTRPPLLVRKARHPPLPRASGKENHRSQRPYGERRIYCRRIERLPVLLELRSGVERRCHNQRTGDMTEHVDEKA